MAKIYLILAVLFLCSCNKTHDITYVVESLSTTTMAYTNEFGDMVEESAILNEQTGNSYWRKEVHYDPKVSKYVEAKLLAFAIEGGEHNHLRAVMYVDKKVIQDTTIYATPKNKYLSLHLTYVVDDKARRIISNRK